MTLPRVVISGTGLYTPEQSVSNEELVQAFNTWVDTYNAEHAEAIARGEVDAKSPSSVEFIEKASGIQSRFVLDKAGILDPSRMVPELPERPNDALSVMAEIGVKAA
ncbi:MAG: beta-ketoacyl-ACP synthase III, partial [Cellvibrionales bacterium]|nr:beta-ketoacyl-ACP synthase III [Cellvibrionales bacterium]